MNNKRVVVLLKYYKGELNPFDGAALECALQMGVREIVALTMAPLSVKAALQSLTRLGVKCVLVSDNVYAGSDTQATSRVLETALRQLQPDYIFCGRQSVDGDTAQVPPMLAQRLGYGIQTRVMAFDGEKFTLRNGEDVLLKDKTIYTFEKIYTLRFPSIFSKVGDVEVWDNSLLQIPREYCGQLGSPTRVIKSYESLVGRRSCRFVDFIHFDDIIKTALLKQKTETFQESEEKLDEAYYVGNVKGWAQRIAKKVVALCVEEKTVEQIADELRSKNVKTVLFEDSEKLKILAARIAVLTGAGLCADCVSFRVKNNKLIMTRPALGGNITADIVNDNEMAFATARTAKKGDGDILFSVGKGGIAHLDIIKALAKKYGAKLCCSRVVADSGVLPYEMQVGLTGKTVNPKVYVAFGVSGAVQHTCAISGAGTVIAVNLDKEARIFDYADYGILSDINTLKIGE
jgi:electron transfer flavoprotein alpha subunit